MRNHREIHTAMQECNCKLDDGTAIDFLNLLFGTRVTRDMPMEIGYAYFLDAMRSMVKTDAFRANIAILTAKFKQDFGIYKPLLDENGKPKPLFPDEANQ